MTGRHGRPAPRLACLLRPSESGASRNSAGCIARNAPPQTDAIFFDRCDALDIDVWLPLAFTLILALWRGLLFTFCPIHQAASSASAADEFKVKMSCKFSTPALRLQPPTATNLSLLRGFSTGNLPKNCIPNSAQPTLVPALSLRLPRRRSRFLCPSKKFALIQQNFYPSVVALPPHLLSTSFRRLAAKNCILPELRNVKLLNFFCCFSFGCLDENYPKFALLFEAVLRFRLKSEDGVRRVISGSALLGHWRKTIKPNGDGVLAR